MHATHQSEERSLYPLVGGGSVRARQAQSVPLQTVSLLDGRITLERRRWTCREAELRWMAPQHVGILTERGGTGRTHVRHGATLAYDGNDRPGAISFVPSGVERHSYFQGADLVYLALWIDPALTLPGCPRLSDPPMQVNARDGVIQSLLGSLSATMAAGQVPEAVYLEHLLALVALRLGQASGGAAPVAPRLPGLGRCIVNRLTDYIEARIDTGISLSELAHLADMPVDTFARRFKTETGMAPYAYVIERRVRRAETLLRTSDMPISAMAFELGFSSQSHFTSTFRRLTGATPNAYRRQGAQDPDTAP